MPHHTRVRLTWVGTTGTVVPEAEFEKFDEGQFTAIDGDTGGVWAPGQAITLGGAGLVMAGPLAVQSGATQTVQSGGALTTDVGSTATLNGATTASDLTMSGTNRVKLASRSFQIYSSVPTRALSTAWEIVAGNVVRSTTSLGAESFAILEFAAPDGATINTIGVRVKGAAGHGALPTSMPAIRVWRTDSDGNIVQIGAIAFDTSPDTTLYQLTHTIAISGLTEVVNRSTRHYSVEFYGEGSTNFVAGLLCYGVIVVGTQTSMAPAAC